MVACRSSLGTLAILGPSIAVLGTKAWNLKSACDILEVHFAGYMMSGAQKEMLRCLCKSVFQQRGFYAAESISSKAFLRKILPNCWSEEHGCGEQRPESMDIDSEQVQYFGQTSMDEQKSMCSHAELVEFISEKIVYITSQVQRAVCGRRAEPIHALQDPHVGRHIRTSVLSCNCSLHDLAGCGFLHSSNNHSCFSGACKSMEGRYKNHRKKKARLCIKVAQKKQHRSSKWSLWKRRRRSMHCTDTT